MHDPTVFAQAWEVAWNSHDLDRIMTHYHDDVVFRSAKAQVMVGQGVLVGKPVLRAYWAKALTNQPDLAFKVVDVFAGHNMLVMTYQNHKQVLAVETLRFGSDGLVIDGAACHQMV